MRYSLHFPDFCLLLLGLVVQFQISRWLYRGEPGRARLLLGLNAASGGLQIAGYLLSFQRVIRYFPTWFSTWVECAGLVWCVALVGIFLGMLAQRSARAFQPPRRQFLSAAGAMVCAAPLVATGFGIIQRNRFQLNEIEIPIPGLPRDLSGLRIVQITDIHLSAFLSEKEFARAIDMANEARAHLGLVTGDLISRRGDPLDACLRQLARLRADAGILGCLGNHEIYTGTEEYVTRAGRRIGIDFLRSEARLLRFGASAINFAGVDYQRMHSTYLEGAERLIAPGALNVMLSHNPDVFPVAARKGFPLTIAGHTHGGQVNFELLHQDLNVARYFTRYVRGLYREGGASIYVSRGLGTIGVPVRIGAPPEVSVLRLCAI
jgi:predicted MPP superfamily phosphohydrolase